MKSAYRFEYAWLGGDTLTAGVTIELDNGRIAAIGTGPGESVSGIALPGMVSAHSHAFHRALRGRTHESGGDFWAWREPMYELANDLTPESYRELATAVFTEMVASGITSVGEFHYLHHQPGGSPYPEPNAMGYAILEAAADVGIRITLLDTLYLTSEVNGEPPLPQQLRFSDGSSQAWAERVKAIRVPNAAARVGVAAHSVRAVPAADLEWAAHLANELTCPLHIHVSEQPDENNATMATHGKSPIGVLGDCGFLTYNTTLIHATHTTVDDRSAISSAGATVCFCPTTEADLGDGIGPAMEYSELGVPLCIGSDSNAIIDPFEEMRRVEHHDRLRLQRRGLHSPVSLLSMATANGARSLGWDSGHLEVGAPGDITVVDHQHLDMASLEPSLGSVVMAATRASVQLVIIDGRCVFRRD